MTMAEKFDLLIKGAKIVDGTGNPHYKSDVGIIKGRIARIEQKISSDAAKAEIQADNQILCPGFLDTHTHDDLYLLARPTCDDKVLQGVTTVVTGNCGLSIAPISEEHETELKMFFGIAGAKYVKEDQLNLHSFDDYLDKLEGARLGINAISLVGHIAIRIAVMGLENRAPSAVEMDKMRELVAESMKSGACGLSSGLIYAPGNFAETAEITELAKVAARYNGIYTTHLRSEGDAIFPALAEAFEIGKNADIPVHVSHHKVTGKQNWGQSVETLKAINIARDSGLTVTCDQYPYLAGSTMLGAALPPSALAEGDRLYAELLNDPSYRANLVETIETKAEKGWENLVKGAGFKGIVISIAPQHPAYIGKSIAGIAEMEHKNPYDVFFDLLMIEKHNVVVVLFMMEEDDIVRIMKAPATMIGSDGIPGFGVEKVHPRQTGTFPRVLGRYVREKEVISLEEAIRKMTSFPAQTFGLKRKGVLKEGFDADLVLFNPETILDLATYEDPNQAPAGISHVLVNGEVAAENGRITGATSGTVMRHGINT